MGGSYAVSRKLEGALSPRAWKPSAVLAGLNGLKPMEVAAALDLVLDPTAVLAGLDIASVLTVDGTLCGKPTTSMFAGVVATPVRTPVSGITEFNRVEARAFARISEFKRETCRFDAKSAPSMLNCAGKVGAGNEPDSTIVVSVYRRATPPQVLALDSDPRWCRFAV